MSGAGVVGEYVVAPTVDGAAVVTGIRVVLLVVVSLMGDGLFVVVVWLHKSSVWLSVAHMISQPV